ncbi:MAG: YchJ family metal-binding protein, partial [Thiothrix litoralis]
GLMTVPPLAWLGLEIVRAEQGGEQDTAGIVEFSARYREGEQTGELHETSRFVKEGGKWYYVDGNY